MSRWGVSVLALCAVLAAPGGAEEPAGPRRGVAPASQPASAPVALAEPLEERAFRLTQTGRYDQAILEAAKAWGLDPFILKGLLFAESGFNPLAVSPKGAIGLAQITPGGRVGLTNLRRARGAQPSRFTVAMALDPSHAIPAAAELLAYHRDQAGGDMRRALAGYNTGSTKKKACGFVRRVHRHTNRFRVDAGLPPLPDPEAPPLKSRRPLVAAAER